MSSPATTAPVIHAAGGVLLRTSGGSQEVLLVHRSRYGDWTLPKGKVNHGETLQAAALREVREETGCEARLESFAGAVGYEAAGVPKIVAFWKMTVTHQGPFTPDSEVAEIAWLPVSEALARLSYDLERKLLAGLVAAPFAPAAPLSVPQWQTRWFFKLNRRAYLRLLRESESLRVELAYLEARAACPHPWAPAAHELLNRLRTGLRVDDPDRGWHILHCARRLTLYGLTQEELQDRARMLLSEAGKLSHWRRDAVQQILAGLSATPPGVSANNVIEAARLIDEYSENTYHRIGIMADQLGLLMWVALMLPVVVLLITVSVLSRVYHLRLPDLRPWDWWVVLISLLMGLLGAGFSATVSVLDSTAKQVSIPERAVNQWVTLTRALFGAVAGLAGYAVLELGLINLGNVLNPGVWLAVSFLFGYAGERPISRIADTITASPQQQTKGK